jgi:ABC-2 type transport system ATP-binding protein
MGTKTDNKTNKKISKDTPKRQRPVREDLSLECVKVKKRYGRTDAVKEISLEVKKGHIVGLFGPDGSGKTSLVKVICNLAQSNGGRILVEGKPVKPEDVSYLPEFPFVNSKQRVGDLVEMYRKFFPDFNVKRAVACFKKIDVSLNDKFCYLSRSSIQKVEAVLVMCRKAKLYILDEPIASVEPDSRDFIIKTIISNCDSDSGVLVASSVVTQLEKIVDEVYIIYKGEIKLSSTAEDIMNDYGKTVSGFYREAFRC